MAIDASTTVTNSTTSKRNIVNDNPNTTNQCRQQIKTTSKTMKLESVQIVTNGNSTTTTTTSNGTTNGYVTSETTSAPVPILTNGHVGHHKSFLEQIRRSITFSSTNNFQLTKLWLFTRQSNRQSWSSTTATVKSNYNNNNNHHTASNLNSQVELVNQVAKVAVNGNSFFSNGYTKLKNGSVNVKHSTSNGAVPNGTNVKTVETTTTPKSRKQDTKATNYDQSITIDSSTCTQNKIACNTTSTTLEEVVESSRASTEQHKEQEKAATDDHDCEHHWDKQLNACDVVLNNDVEGRNDGDECHQDNEPIEAITVVNNQIDHSHVKVDEVIEVCNLFTDTESVTSFSYDTTQQETEIGRLAVEDNETLMGEEEDRDVIESIVKVNTIELEEESKKDQVEDVQYEQRKQLVPTTTDDLCQPKNHDGHEVPLQTPSSSIAVIASPPTTINSLDNGTVVVAASGLTVSSPLNLTDNDEQILESLRQVVRICTKTDLKKRASIGAVYELLDSRIRSLVPRKVKVNKARTKTSTNPKSCKVHIVINKNQTESQESISQNQKMSTSSV